MRSLVLLLCVGVAITLASGVSTAEKVNGNPAVFLSILNKEAEAMDISPSLNSISTRITANLEAVRQFRFVLGLKLKNIDKTAKAIVDLNLKTTGNKDMLNAWRTNMAAVIDGVTSLRPIISGLTVAAKEVNSFLPINTSNKARYLHTMAIIRRLLATMSKKKFGPLCKSCRKCHRSSKCLNKFGTVLCLCANDRFGKYCKKNRPSRCGKKTCKNGAACLSTKEGTFFKCDCKKGFEGSDCGIVTDLITPEMRRQMALAAARREAARQAALARAKAAAEAALRKKYFDEAKAHYDVIINKLLARKLRCKQKKLTKKARVLSKAVKLAQKARQYLANAAKCSRRDRSEKCRAARWAARRARTLARLAGIAASYRISDKSDPAVFSRRALTLTEEAEKLADLAGTYDRTDKSAEAQSAITAFVRASKAAREARIEAARARRFAKLYKLAAAYAADDDREFVTLTRESAELTRKAEAARKVARLFEINDNSAKAQRAISDASVALKAASNARKAAKCSRRISSASRRAARFALTDNSNAARNARKAVARAVACKVRNVKKALKKALDTLSRVPSDAARKRVQRLQRKLAKRLRKTNPCSKKNNACLNGSACKIGKSGKAKCMCKNGFNGRLCQKNVDECANKPCGNGAECIDGIATFKCKCAPGFGGTTCMKVKDVCLAKAPCKNLAQCINKGKSSYKCLCPTGWAGRTCAKDYNDCISSPCKNGASCKDLFNDFKCKCPAGFKGKRCEININDCKGNPCAHGGRCIDGINSFKCKCPKGFSGKLCETNIDDCKRNPCKNFGICTDLVAGFKCKCQKGFSGPTCKNNIDDCKSGPCRNGGKCVDGVNSFKCKCPKGFSGRTCRRNINDCADRPCKNGARCIDGINSFTCACRRGFAGRRCGKNINDCAKNPCQNEGKCIDGIDSYKCRCLPGFKGINCEININDCKLKGSKGSPCQNGGACFDMINAYKCKCRPGYFGKNCEKGVKCAPLRAPDNGFVKSSNKNIFPSKSRYSCKAGYILSKRKSKFSLLQLSESANADPAAANKKKASRRQRINRAERAARKALKKAKTPKFADAVVKTVKKVARKVFSWAARYRTISSSRSTRTCKPSGKWSGRGPICRPIRCARLGKVSFGSVSTSNRNFFPSNAVYSCEPGFRTTDPLERSCNADGSWSGKAPRCKGIRGQPALKAKNAFFHVSNKGRFPSNAKYTCVPGYTTRDATVVSLSTDGTWASRPPLCFPVKCANVRRIKKGTWSSTNNHNYPSTLTYKCHQGYYPRGSNVRKCGPDGKWSGKRTRCIGVPAQTLPKLFFGKTKITNRRRYPATATFSCRNGYQLKGPATRITRPDGSWSGKQPKCKGVVCAPLPEFAHGSVLKTNGGRYPSVATFSCENGYTLSRSPAARSCRKDGSWAGKAVSCLPVSGKAAPSVKYGSVRISGTSYPASAIYTCDAGYKRNGAKTLKMKEDGSWDGAAPTCESRTCDTLAAPKYGRVKTTNDGSFPSTASYKCNNGFEISSTKPRQCLPNGKWSRKAPRCLGAACEPLERPRKGSVKVTNEGRFPSKAIYTCKKGYVTEENRVRKCTKDGVWTPNAPKCKGVKCDNINVPRNGRVFQARKRFPAAAQFSCRPGYVLEGRSELNCKTDGTWNGDVPQCVRGKCPAPTAQKPLKVFISRGKAEFRCSAGYNLIGSRRLLCNAAEGTWQGDVPTCEGVRGGEVPSLRNGTLSRITNNNRFPAKAYFKCKPGFGIVGRNFIRLGKDGRWPAAALPVCGPGVCDAAPSVKNGRVRITSTTFPSNMTTTCREGFVRTEGSELRKCRKSGRWSGDSVICLGVKCKTLNPPQFGLVQVTSDRYPSKASYTCMPGYKLSVPAPRRCKKDGSWLGAKPLCEKIVKKPVAPFNGNVTISKRVHPSVASYTCRDGCKLVGSKTRLSDSMGEWEGKKPVCKCLDFTVTAVSANSNNAPEGKARLYVNSELVMETVAEQYVPVQTWASARRGDVLAVSVSETNFPAFIGSFNFKDHTFHTNQAWKCSSRYVSGWSDNNFDDSDWEFAKTRVVGDRFARHLGNYVNQAVPIWAGSNDGLFCRFRIGGFTNALLTKNMAGFGFFNSVFNHGKKGNYWGTAQVKCDTAFAITFKNNAYSKETDTMLSFIANARGSKLRTLQVHHATREEARDSFGKAQFATERGVAKYEDGGRMVSRRRIVKDDGLLVSGKPLACTGDFVDVWFQVKENTLSVGAGATVGSSVLLSYSSDSLAGNSFFAFSNIWGNRGTSPASTRVRNLKWGPKAAAPVSVHH